MLLHYGRVIEVMPSGSAIGDYVLIEITAAEGMPPFQQLLPLASLTGLDQSRNGWTFYHSPKEAEAYWALWGAYQRKITEET